MFPHLCKTASPLHSPAHLSLPDPTTGRTGCSLQRASISLGAGYIIWGFLFQQSPRMSQNADLHPLPPFPWCHNCSFRCPSHSLSFSHLPSPCPSDCKVLRKPPQVPTCQPKHLVLGVGAKEGSSLGSAWPLFCKDSRRGWGFSHLAGFLSLSPMWVLRFQQNRLWQKGPPPSQHTSEVFIQCGACDLASMGFGRLSISHRSSVGVSPAWTLVLLSPQICSLSCCPARGADVFLYG